MMEKRLALGKYGLQLWTRELARTIRVELNKLFDETQSGGVVVIDADEVEVFDFSFANELFGKSALGLSNEYPGRFLIVENLKPYARENLIKTLESLGIAMIERTQGKLNIIGKVHQAYLETFLAVTNVNEPVTANMIKDILSINLTAANERLTKLTNMSLLRREKRTSGTGREQYVYLTAQ